MADNLTTTTEVDAGVELYYDRVLLINAKPKLVHDRFAQMRPLPQGNSKIIKFRRYTKLATATAQLSEGVTPPGKKLTKNDISATVAQYGDFVHLTDVVELTNTDGELNKAGDLLGEQMGETHDQIIRDHIMQATGSLIFSTGGGHLNTADLDTIILTLLGNDAQMITSLVHATTGVGTTPVRPSFWAILHPAMIDDLEDLSTFQSTSTYPSQDTVDEAEWGSTNNIRWLVSSVARRSASRSHPNDTSAPTFNWIPIIGQNAYGITELSGGNAKSIIKALGSGGTADPLNQRSTMGWKAMLVARVLNDNFMHLAIVDHSG